MNILSKYFADLKAEWPFEVTTEKSWSLFDILELLEYEYDMEELLKEPTDTEQFRAATCQELESASLFSIPVKNIQGYDKELLDGQPEGMWLEARYLGDENHVVVFPNDSNRNATLMLYTREDGREESQSSWQVLYVQLEDSPNPGPRASKARIKRQKCAPREKRGRFFGPCVSQTCPKTRHCEPKYYSAAGGGFCKLCECVRR